MLESILIKNVATYDSHVGVHITGLKKVNFIYGANSCGKTTITKFISEPEHINFQSCQLGWQNSTQIPALVYNKDFRDRNFGKGNIAGVFTLGEATSEQIKAIETMHAELDKIKTNGVEKKATIDRQTKECTELEDSFREACWSTVYKKYENDFKDGFVGVIKKELFKDRLLSEAKNNLSELKSFEDLKEKSLTIFGQRPTELILVTLLNFNRVSEIEGNGIWKKKIIGKTDVDIAKLIQKLNINDWVNEGRDHLQDEKTCPFCQKDTITNDFRKQLDDYFDEAFTKEIEEAKTLGTEYQILTTNLENLLVEIAAEAKKISNSKLDVEIFSAYIKTAVSQFRSNRELINNKLKEPSRIFTLTSTSIQNNDIQNLIVDANKLITEHNNIVINFDREKSKLITMIWKFLADGYKTEIDNFTRKRDGLVRGIEAIKVVHLKLQTDYSNLNKEIKEANKNVTGVQSSVDQINKILVSYGFTNFKIVPSKTAENQYQIQRDDETLAESTLSEGEITFITFLYFLQLAKGGISEDTVTQDRILVVDDPISSLDSNVLFVVSSLLKEIIKKIKKKEGHIKQIILLTHNVYFHKEVSFIDGRSSPNNPDTSYWILRKNHNVSSVQNYEENPINSSYELLWKELKNSNNNSGITVQNTMRRIIENYFKILGKYGDDELINKFDNHQDQEICRSLICWINDGSHSMPDDLFIEHQGAISEKYFEIFERIFEQMGHPEHFNMMMKVTPAKMSA